MLKANFGALVPVILLPALLISAPARGEANRDAEKRENAAVFQDAHYFPLQPDEKFHIYLRSAFGGASIFTGAFSAGYNQAIDSVPEWGQGMEGYGKRLASSFGQKVAGQTVNSGMKMLLREDPRYFYSDRRGIKRRTLHAVGETFVAHMDSGGARPNYSFFAGVASGLYISRQWRPENRRGAMDYARGAAVSVGIQSAKNVFMEFWPDIKKRLPTRKR